MIKKYVLSLFIVFLLSTQFSGYAQARRSPLDRDVDESITDSPPLTTDQLDELRLMSQLSTIDYEVERLQTAFGTLEEAGVLKRIRLKPSDKKRLIRLSNNSLSEAQKKKIYYDKDLLRLLTGLTAPEDVGGESINFLRVGDLLRFKADPRSRETEGAQNISQHQFGKAADIIEINKTHCVAKSLLGGSKDLPAFPVKVIWQGGAPYNPGMNSLGSFDAIARLHAFRDIIGALPGKSYNGSVQGLEDLLQQMQRRVIANEIGFSASSLDYLVNNDTLETLGRVALGDALHSNGPILGDTKEQIIHSLALNPIEQELVLPPGSLKGDTLMASLERLGRYKVALDNNIPVDDVLGGRIGNLPYYNQYGRTAEAFRLPDGVLEGIRGNQPRSFAAVGALVMADRLRYSPDEAQQLMNQAKNGNATQLTLGRYGDIRSLPGSPLLILAPGNQSSKGQGESYIGSKMLEGASTVSYSSLPEEIRGVFSAHQLRLSDGDSRQTILEQVFQIQNNHSLFREIGAAYMETALDLPSRSFSEALRKNDPPSFDQFKSALSQRLKEEESLTGNEALNNRVQDYIANDFVDAFQSIYPVSTVGLNRFSKEEMYDIMLGKISEIATRAGASWVEEGVGVTPDSFSVLFVKDSSAEERLVNAGIAVLGGELFEAFDVDGQNITDGTTVKIRLGQAKFETSLGLKPGSFRDSLNKVKEENKERFATIFASPSTVDVIAGIPDGTTERFLHGQVSPQDIAKQIGEEGLKRIDTTDLQNKFGWDSRFKIDGKKLLTAINGSGEFRSILAEIGGFNLDYHFGYDPGTMKKWAAAGSQEEKNKLLLIEGGKLYADRSGFQFNNRDDYIRSYLENNPGLRSNVMGRIKESLERPLPHRSQEDVARSSRDSILRQISILSDQLDNDGTSNSEIAARNALESMRRELQNNSSSNSRDVLSQVQRELNGLEQLIQQAGANDPESQDYIHTSGDLIRSTASQLTTIINRITHANDRPSNPIHLPSSEVLSFVNGDMWQAAAVTTAANQAKSSPVDFQVDGYNLFRLLAAGWSNDQSFEATIRTYGINQYAAILNEANLLNDFSRVDQTFGAITKGVLTSTAGFNPNESPYPTATSTLIKNGYFANSEAQNTYFYGLLDAQIRKQNPDIPPRFSETLLEGTLAQRSHLLFTSLGSELSQSLLSGLPAELRSVVQSFLTTLDPTVGQVLSANSSFTSWAVTAFNQLFGINFSNEEMSVGTLFAAGIFSSDVIQNSGLNLGTFGEQQTVQWVGNQLDLPNQDFEAIYTRQHEHEQFYDQFDQFQIDPIQGAFTLDNLLFDGAMSDFLGALDDALGLPAGSTQLLVSFAITGNPIDLVQFVFNIFFGTTIECPDLQQEAEKNVKLLIRDIIHQGKPDASLIPSQIITFKKDYLEELEGAIARNYFPCDKNTQCGVFARPEYAKQVHIGF